MDLNMSMGIEEQRLVGLCHNNKDANHVAKGKRTKRQRPLSPCAVAATAVTSSCSSANSGGGGGGDHGSFSSSTTPFESTGKEEEEMANCLILLAQGKREGNDGGGGSNKKITYTTTGAATTNIITTTATATTTATTTKNGFYNYECKTCNKTFPSFQALGGHRASHKKPKMNLEEKKSLPSPPPPSSSSPIIFEFEEAKQTNIKSSSQIPISLQLGCGNNIPFHGNKSKIHECSICGAEFTSGQALGGHMRRHRTSTNAITNTSTHVVNMSGSETNFDASAAAATTTTTTTVEVKHCNVLEIDLNLPAPEENIRDSNFQFTTTSKSMVLPAAPALIGCHY